MYYTIQYYFRFFLQWSTQCFMSQVKMTDFMTFLHRNKKGKRNLSRGFIFEIHHKQTLIFLNLLNTVFFIVRKYLELKIFKLEKLIVGNRRPLNIFNFSFKR